MLITSQLLQLQGQNQLLIFPTFGCRVCATSSEGLHSEIFVSLNLSMPLKKLKQGIAK